MTSPAIRIPLGLALGFALLLSTSMATAWPGGSTGRGMTPAPRRPVASLLRRAIAPIRRVVRRTLTEGPTASLVRRGLEGGPMGGLVKGGAVRQVKHLLFVGALERANQRSRFRAFVREVDRHDARERLQPRAAELAAGAHESPAAAQEATESIVAEHPTAAEIYGNSLRDEGTGRRRVKLLFGLTLALAGNHSSLVHQDPVLALLVAFGGAAIFVENNWWLSEKVDKAIRSTLKQIRDRGVTIPEDLSKWYSVKSKTGGKGESAEGPAPAHAEHPAAEHPDR